jgi:RNA 2',3'-cyclic 3'-phosphodiesterase
MIKQLSFDEMEGASSPTDRLLLATFPGEAAASSLERAAYRYREEHGLSGPPLAPGRLHITLHHIGDYAGLSERLIADVKDAAATLVVPPFDVTFDRVGSFAGRPSNFPFVLRGGDGLDALVAFQRALIVALQKSGVVRRAAATFTPHVTLLYDERSIVEHPVEPISWTVREFVLVHSLLGQTRHIPLARWSLRG